MKTLRNKIDLTRPDIDDYLSANGRKKRSRLAADIRACLIVAVCVLLFLVLVIAYYSELMARGEGYYSRPNTELTTNQARLINDRKTCEMLNPDEPMCCQSNAKQKLKNLLGCR